MITIEFHYGNSNAEIMQLQVTETKVLRIHDRGKAMNIYLDNKEQVRELFTEVAKLLALFEGEN